MRKNQRIQERKVMKTRIIAAVLLMSTLLLQAGDAFSDSTGLWAGDVKLYEVSGVGRAAANVAFDLALKGARAWDVLIGRASTDWKYENSGGDLGGTWMQNAYPDAGWPSGTGPIVSSSVGQPTVYFRKSFNVSSALKYSGMKLRLLKDDGAVIYLNGEEIMKSNLPSNVSYGTFAMSEITGSGETEYVEYVLPASRLQDGSNLIAAEIHRSGASDADLKFDLELLGVLETPLSTNIINAKSDWSYISEGTVPAAGWTDISFVDTAWKSAAGAFGYGNQDGQNGSKGQDTLLASGPSDNRHPAFYFRKHFSVIDRNDYTGLTLFLRRNDGAVVYLNGAEVLRSNMPEGPITSTTPPLVRIGPDETAKYIMVELGASGLVTGGNVIAVEVHQHNAELNDNTAVGSLTKTPAELNMHILLHADTSGAVKLLKEVFIMKDPADGHTVLLTDHSLIPNFSGVSWKEGTTQGARLSSVSYDFDGQSSLCTGGMSSGSSLTCAFTLGRTKPTNPFLHRYNTQHDEKDSFLADIPSDSRFHEVSEVRRVMTLTFSSRYPSDPRITVQRTQPPGWGETKTGGEFSETMDGLIKDQIEVHGYFDLRKISDRGELNR